jgi:probable phosphomutase (TIGR03848 family)
MTTVLLIRHGLTALTASTLLGWTTGVPLDEHGRAQAASVAARLRKVPLAAIVSSPIERCRETAEAVLAERDPAPPFELDERLGDVRYGDWTGRPFKELHRDPLWKSVMANPADVTFPNGEALRDMAIRAIASVRDWNARLGPDATFAIVSHADPIRAILADALGLHLEGYGRLVVGPGSLSVVRYDGARPVVLRVNDVGDDSSDLLASSRRPRRPRSHKERTAAVPTGTPGQMA